MGMSIASEDLGHFQMLQNKLADEKAKRGALSAPDDDGKLQSLRTAEALIEEARKLFFDSNYESVNNIHYSALVRMIKDFEEEAAQFGRYFAPIDLYPCTSTEQHAPEKKSVAEDDEVALIPEGESAAENNELAMINEPFLEPPAEYASFHDSPVSLVSDHLVKAAEALAAEALAAEALASELQLRAEEETINYPFPPNPDVEVEPDSDAEYDPDTIPELEDPSAHQVRDATGKPQDQKNAERHTHSAGFNEALQAYLQGGHNMLFKPVDKTNGAINQAQSNIAPPPAPIPTKC